MENNFDRESMGQEPENNQEDQKRIDSIPLWLQGIVENNAAANTAAENSDNDEWQKEQTMESKQDTGPVSLELTDQILPEEGILLDEDEPDANSVEDSILPDWVSELKESSDEEKIKTFPGISTTPFDEIETEIEDEDEDENTEEVLLDFADDPDMQEEMIAEIDQATPEDAPPPATPQTAEESLTIDSEASFDDEAMAEEEEIPSWLREMIAADEKQQSQSWSQPEKAGYSDETTQPVMVKQADENEPVADEIETNQEFPVSEDVVLEADEIEEEPEYPAAPVEDIPADPPARPAVMPTANWSRLADLPEQVEEPEEQIPDIDTEADVDEAPIFEAPNDVTEPEEESEAETQTEVVEEAEPFSPDTYAKQFEGTGFKPIEFGPAKPEPVKEPEFDEKSLPSEALEVPTPVVNLKPAPSEPVFIYKESEAEIPEPAYDGPTSLAQAKQILDQGEVHQALPIIRSHIDRAENLDEIKGWLLAANNNIKKNKAEIWEALGDIASLEGDFSTALSAYAKAIDYLELARKNIE